MSTRIADVRKSFGGVQVLHGVELTIGSGEFVALLGASGCGKTTLLRIMAGFERPTSGEVWIDDQLVGSSTKSVPTERRNLGMVFQSHALWPHLDVAEHIRFPLRYQRRSDGSAAHTARVEAVLELTGLTELRTRLPHQLSGGQRQRLSLARAIAAEPSLLLMDEPLSSLDANLRDDMRREIQTLHQATRASVVYVTHDQSEALAMADRVVVLNEGRPEQIGAPEEVYSRPATPFVARFVGKANLVKGTWKGDEFLPDSGDGRVVWAGPQVADTFRQDGLFPARPDQLSPCAVAADTGGTASGRMDKHRDAAAEDGVEGVVRTALFQGRDVQYTVQVRDEEWQVYGGPVAGIGDSVRIRFDSAPQR